MQCGMSFAEVPADEFTSLPVGVSCCQIRVVPLQERLVRSIYDFHRSVDAHTQSGVEIGGIFSHIRHCDGTAVGRRHPRGKPGGRRTIHRVNLLIAAVAVALLVSLPLARLASWRSTRQPAPFDLKAETDVLSAIANDPVQWAWVSPLTEDHFVHPAHRAAWRSVTDLLGHLPLPEGPVDEQAGAAWIESLRGRSDLPAVGAVRSAIELALTTTPNGDAEPAPALATEDVSHDRLAGAFADLLACFDDRGFYVAFLPVVAGGPGEPLLLRRYRKPGIAYVATTALLTAASAVAASFTARAVTDALLPQVLITASLLVLGIFSVLWALVDFATMYLDTPTFYIGSFSAWALAVAGAVIDGHPGRLIAGLAIAFGGGCVFVGSNYVYQLVRGRNGMGLGDTFILFATAGVPTAVTGDWQLGYWTLIMSMVLGIIGWGVLRLVGMVTKDSPFAFGPYLALGWILSSTAWAVTLLV